jgi:hypothetical protein
VSGCAILLGPNVGRNGGQHEVSLCRTRCEHVPKPLRAAVRLIGEVKIQIAL